METELKDSVLHLGEKQFSDGKNNSLGEDIQPEVFCNASVDEQQNGNGCSSQVKSALVQSPAPRHCPDGDQADLGGSSQLDQQPATERELDGSPGTDVETKKESLLSGSFSSFEPCRESLSCEENICTLDSGSIGYAEKEFQEHLLESCLSDFGSSGSSGLVDLSMSCMDRLIGTLDFPQPDSYQRKEPEQDDEVPEDDQCPSVFFVSCVTSSTVNNLPGNPASAVEQPTAGVTEAPNKNVCRSDQQSQMVLATTTESPDNDESQLSSHRDFHLGKEKDHGLHNDSHADGLSTNSYKGVFSLSHDDKLHGATEQRDENCEEDLKSNGMCEEECVNNTMHPGVDKQQGMVARQDFKNLKSSDLSLLTAASGGAKSNQLLSKEHEQVLQMLGLSDSVDATTNPADSDLVMSSSSQEEDSPAAPPVDKNAQILPSVSHHCEQGTSESDMDPRPSEQDAACMQHGFFLNLEEVEFPPTCDSDSSTSVTSSCDSPPNGLHVQETSRQNACEAAECTATSKVDSVGQTEQMPCSIDKYITKAKDGTMKPDVDAEDSPIKPDVDAELSPFSSFGDFSMLELPAEVTEGKEQVRAISSICCQEVDNADVYGREDPVPQKALFGNNAHKSRENSSVSDSENSDSIFDAENRHWGSGNHMDPGSNPASLMQNSSYRPVAAPRSKTLGQATSCFSAGLQGSQEPQPKSGLQDQRKATETDCPDLSQNSLIKPLQDRASPDHLSSQNTEVDLFTTGSSSPDMSEHSPDSSKGILHSGYPHQLTRSPFTVTQNTAEISHESPAVPSFGFGQSSFTPQPQQSQSFETDHTRVQSQMQEKTHDVYMNPDWSVIIPDNTHAQPCHTLGTAFHPSPQESQFATQSQSCFALQGKKPQLGPHNSQSSLRQNLHQPQRHQPEEQKWQTAEHIMQNQRQEEREVELKTVVVTGPSLGPEQEELCSLYFESSKRSGGGEIQEGGIIWDEERRCFFITFLDSQAAKNVTSREHTLKKSPIQVELWSPSQQCGCKGGSTMPMSKDASTPSAPAHYKDRVLVSGVPSETTSDLLLNYLECVADVAVEDIQKKGDSVLVIFKSSEQDFNVREMLSACEENPLSPGVHMTFKEVPLPRAVFVTGLKTSTVDDAIKLYFSNKKRNGGGPVEKVERASDRRSAVVYFKNCDDAASVAKKGNHTLDGNKLQVTVGTESDEEDSPGQHKATRGFPAAGDNESSSDDEDSGGWSEDAASVAKKGNHTLDGNKLQVTVGTESDEEDSPGQHKATRGFPAAGDNESSSDDKDSGGWSEGPIPCENDYSNCHNHSHRGADLIPQLSHSSSAPQARTTEIKLSEQSLHKVVSDSSLLRKLTSAVKSVDGKFHWKQPDGIIITCLNGQPPHDWEHQVGRVVEKFFQEIEAAVPTARSAPQKPDITAWRNNSSSEMHETPMPSLASSHSVTKRLMPATDILEDTISHLKPCQLKVLRIPTALKRFIKGYPGLEVTVDEVTKTAKVRAPEDAMPKAFSDILAFVALLREVKIRLSPALVEMYKKEDTKDWIHTTLIVKHELVCHWELCDDLIVLSGQSSDLSRLEKMFRSAFEEKKVEIEKKEQCLLKLPAWLSFLESLQESRAKYPIPVVLPEGCNIVIVDTPSNVNKTRLKLKNFFDENRPEEKTLKIDQNHLKFLKHYFTEEIKEVHKRAKDMGVSVNFNKTGMVAEGPKDNLPGPVREVKELLSRIKEDKMTFKKPGAAKYLTGDKGQEFLQQTGLATECFITTSDDGKMSSTHSVGRVLAEVKLGPDQQLLLAQGDITQCEVDGIVNAANGQLNHGGGVAAAIVKAGGSCIQEESDELIAKQGDLSEGEVVVTRAGSLGCSWILHAVGPTWKGGLKEEDQLLKRTVLVTLKKAHEMKMKSIAMPAISCGIFRYPIDKATRIILQAIGMFFTEDGRDSCLKTVMLIDMTDKTLHSFLSAGKVLFGKQLQVKDQPKPTTQSSRHRDDHRSEQGASHGSHSDDAHSDRSHLPIKIISGEIAKSRADVIVCTLHPSLDLRKGVLSKSILEEGGETIQQELRKFHERHGPARIGSVVRTTGGNLHCKYLFHLSLPTWRDDHGQKMQSAVKECLEEASRKRARSIAFPTLGTGKLGYPGNQVASTMFSVISKWLQDHHDSSVKEVQIIVFPKDNETLQDFKAAEGGGGSHTGGRGRGHRDRGGDTALSVYQGKPCNVKVKESKTARGARDQWGVFSSCFTSQVYQASGGFRWAGQLSLKKINILPGGQSSLKIKMGKITVMVKVGDILTEPCDAVVNSSNDDLDLSRGVLSKAILKCGGRDIVAECRDQKEQMADTGVAVTSVENSQLSCGRVIHVSADRFKHDWHRGILTVLRTADAEGIQSVALPALGTGGRGADPQALAQAMQEAVSQFASRARSVNEVRVVVFQKQMLQPYIAAFSASSRGAEGSDSDAETSLHSKQKMWQEVDVYIYSSQDSAIRNAREKIYKHMKDVSVSRTEKDSLIANFDSKQVEELFKLQNKHKVDITLDKKKSAVTVTGIDIDVAKAISDLKSIMLSASKQHHLAAGLPPVRWQYEKGKDKFADFDPENTVIIEAAFKKRERSVQITDKRGRQYKIDFKDRKEYCISDNHAPPVAVKRRDLLQERKDEIPLPNHWAPMNGQKVKVVSLKPDSSEYKKVAQHFSGGGQVAVKKIERIQNPSLFQQFKVKKRELELYNPKGTENEKRLFHGTSSDSIKGIIANGFNRSYCGKNGTALGAGVYFAADSGTSMGFAQGGQMFQARVLVGEYTPGNSSMRMAPNKPNSNRPYDSVSNAASNATVFVIFHDSQAYPEYLISF